MDKTVADTLDRFAVTEATRRFLAGAPRMLIDGAFVDAGDGATHAVHEPSTEGLITHVPAATTDDVDRAVRAANRAFEGWSRSAPKQREQVLLKLADLVEQHAQTLAEIETLDNGKAIGGCHISVILLSPHLPNSIGYYRYSLHRVGSTNLYPKSSQKIVPLTR
jgi:phenylacetaldehyde dehydrogenase